MTLSFKQRQDRMTSDDFELNVNKTNVTYSLAEVAV